jgi:hypothetical protein
MPNRSRSKFSKFYFPGLISLICLPLLCIGYFAYGNYFQKIGVIGVTWYDTNGFNEMAKYTHMKIDINTFRKYTILSFNGDVKHSEFEMKRLNELVSSLSRKKDSVNAIKITYERGAVYKDFVSAVDAGHQYGEKNIGTLLYNNEIYIYYHKPPKNTTATTIDNGPITIKQPAVFFSMQRLRLAMSQLCQNLLDLWPSAIAFIAMVGFAISKKRYYYLPKPTISTNH